MHPRVYPRAQWRALSQVKSALDVQEQGGLVLRAYAVQKGAVAKISARYNPRTYPKV
ncbi:hypothetical protein BDZ89DRAFT_1080038 [Hymenopellis radicata]|nr:hypothetical protein BDZ89DRAFT_1080038 [Hymenopellis radicata]